MTPSGLPPENGTFLHDCGIRNDVKDRDLVVDVVGKNVFKHLRVCGLGAWERVETGVDWGWQRDAGCGCDGEGVQWRSGQSGQTKRDGKRGRGSAFACQSTSRNDPSTITLQPRSRAS